MEGLTSIRSSFGPKETMDRLEAEIRRHAADAIGANNWYRSAIEGTRLAGCKGQDLAFI